MGLHPAVVQVADRLGVPIVPTSEPPDAGLHGWLDRWMYVQHREPDRVFLWEAAPGALEWEQGPTWTCPARLLHEIMHVICCPPGETVDDRHELWMLMPVEREFARRAFLDDPVAMDRLMDFQLGTKVQWEGRTLLSEFDGQEEQLPVWREALDMAHRIGLLKEGRPTWERADWSRF